MGKLFADSGVVTLTAFISPYRKDRDFGRSLLEPGRFIEVFVKASIDTCKDRDPKGLYAKALRGEIAEFTGVTAPYEEPLQPEIVLDADVLTVEEEAERIVSYLNEKGLLQG